MCANTQADERKAEEILLHVMLGLESVENQNLQTYGEGNSRYQFAPVNTDHTAGQCFSNWVPRHLRVPQNTVWGSERNNGIHT